MNPGIDLREASAEGNLPASILLASCFRRDPRSFGPVAVPKPGDEPRHPACVGSIDFSELPFHLGLLPACQARVHEEENGPSETGDDGWPLDEEPDGDEE